MKIVLVGQPNCGKSTIFNSVIGYKSIESNLPGVTVEFTEGETIIENMPYKIVDLPGIYSMNPTDEAEKLTFNYLINSKEDYIILNVIDASVLSRSLELTFQLMELEKPMVIALNMIDDAEKKGIEIDSEKLSKKLGISVHKTIAKKGVGISELFSMAANSINNKIQPYKIEYSKKSEESLTELINQIPLDRNILNLSDRFLLLNFLEENIVLNEIFRNAYGEERYTNIKEKIDKIENDCGQKLNQIFHIERHNSAFQLFESTSKITKIKKQSLSSKIDNILMHPFLGYLSLIIILFLFFEIIFLIGGVIEPIFVNNFDNFSSFLEKYFNKHTFVFSFINGAVYGIVGGFAIVVPYLLPFFLILAFLEDTGYLTRIAYLLDNLMHKIGLHGMSIIPLILGYGCTVPAIISTRILRSKRDKFITATLATLIPCTARMTTIFALVGFFISLEAAIFIYVLNLAIVAISGKVLTKIYKEVTPGLILEMPNYHLPSFKVLLNKTWFRLKEFVIIAWPLLIIGSIILELINLYHLSEIINNLLSPFTVSLLGLPSLVGITLIFGIMRKELTIILLWSVFGTKDLADVMTTNQIFIYTIFVTFYLPCLATFAALIREIKLKNAILVSVVSFIIAIILSLLFRFFGMIF